MKAIWTAPVLDFKELEWPCKTDFETWTEFPRVWHNFDYELWYCNPSANFVIDAAVLSHFPRLECIVTPSTGTNHIDIPLCHERGIDVRCLLDAPRKLEEIRASSEFAFLMILNSLRRLDKLVVKEWHRDEDTMRGFELAGKNVGFIGGGR